MSNEMDAMIFAAGHGTRLRPLTNEIPKALVEVNGAPMLERVARRLVDAGADRLIVNTHPFADRIVEFVTSRNGFGVEVEFSHEPDEPLDTGGGLRQASPLLRRDAPFFLHNCDVLSDIDRPGLYAAHAADGSAIATLAVLPASAERYLLFDDHGLCGYAPRGGGEDVLVREPASAPERKDFAGIHVASTELLHRLPETRVFSIVWTYLDCAARGERVAGFACDDARWIDIGSPEKLARAAALFPANE
jgi:NDP-sugar pyrophosphorylase family protein